METRSTRTNQHTNDGYRNGSYERQFTTRVGTINLEVPRDRDGTFQTRLFQRYQRSEKALVLALMQMVVQGVSTRRVKKITTELCGRKFSKSTVSRLTTELDGQVEAWAKRPLEKNYPFLVLDAMHVKVRRQGAVRSMTVMLAVGINAAGHREILGLETAFGETGDAWRRFIEGLKRRGLSGVEVATSDAHEGLRSALASAFPGLIWQRCQAHFRRNVIDQTPATLRERMHEMLDQVLGACSPERARETVIRIFPNLTSAQRLIGALCAEQHEEWSTGRRYLIMDEFFEWKRRLDMEPVSPDASTTSKQQPAAVAA